LGAVHENGVAVDLEESLSGVISVAAPIFDHTGRVVAAMGVSGPTSRMTSKLNTVKQDVRNAALAATSMIAPYFEVSPATTRANAKTRPRLRMTTSSR
jgi:DNA-binding IclR family transcriptional regulator